MNKQELISRLIKLLEAPSEIEGSDFDNGHNYGIERAIILAEQLNEQQAQINKPEKHVVPQFVADMIVKRKKQGDSLVATLVNLGAFGDAQRWIRNGDNGDTFAKAWLFGYEVEKEKLYTAKLKLTNEYLGYESQLNGLLRYESQLNGLLHYKVPDSSAKEVTAFHFTEDDLVKYHIWGNDTYEVREVEDE